LGGLFSDHNGDHVKTEIVLQITPHIVRPQLTMDSDTRELWSGTDTNVRTEQLRLDPSRPVASSATGAPALPYTPVKPGQVGGGTMGPPPAASGSAATAPKSAFGQPPPPMRTTPPPAPYNGRFSGTPAVPQGKQHLPGQPNRRHHHPCRRLATPTARPKTRRCRQRHVVRCRWS
jgi:general secretion pathway protein D